MKSDLIDLDARLVHETEKAWLIDTGDKKSVWIAKSMAEFDGKTLTLRQSLAEEKGLV